MLEQLNIFAQSYGLSAEVILLTGLGLGVLIVFLGIASAFSRPDPALRRMSASGVAVSEKGKDGSGSGLVRSIEKGPKGFLKSLVPVEEEKRSLVRQQLIHAGINSKNAVINYYVIRAVLGFGLPAIVITIIVGRGVFPYPEGLDNFLLGLDRMKVLQIVGLAVAVGFYAPAYWLRGKVKARQTRVERAFPNAMDLLQISVEAGMGFDAAMSRVGHELRSVAPEISEEFSVVQAEILAGRSRSKALNDMAMRMGIEEATSFANVIVQSIRYGTPLSSALATYSEEMRNKRQMKAEEKANKLPVLMSGVLASLMLPALLLITLGPVIIRYVRYFGS